jgi:hypothetical protein
MNASSCKKKLASLQQEVEGVEAAMHDMASTVRIPYAFATPQLQDLHMSSLKSIIDCLDLKVTLAKASGGQASRVTLFVCYMPRPRFHLTADSQELLDRLCRDGKGKVECV